MMKLTAILSMLIMPLQSAFAQQFEFNTNLKKSAAYLGFIDNRIKMLTAGKSHTCALVGSEVFCWGKNYNGTIPIKLQNPRMIAAGGDVSCAMEDSGIVCWGSSILGRLLGPIPSLTNPKLLAIGQQSACA
jgi:hypothetical protein